MVQAILDGRKTMTRRVLKPQPELKGVFWHLGGAAWSDNIKSFHPVPCHSLYGGMRYKPGDILWVRETWLSADDGFHFKADIKVPSESERVRKAFGYKWRPSIFMPLEAARIFLRVTDVTVERLKDMYDHPNEALREGMPPPVVSRDEFEPVSMFRELWDSIYTSRGYGWDTNPWVWVISFERIDASEATQ